MSQNFRLFHISNLSVRNFRIFLLIYTGSLTAAPARDAPSSSPSGALNQGGGGGRSQQGAPHHRSWPKKAAHSSSWTAAMRALTVAALLGLAALGEYIHLSGAPRL